MLLKSHQLKTQDSTLKYMKTVNRIVENKFKTTDYIKNIIQLLSFVLLSKLYVQKTLSEKDYHLNSN